MVEFPTMATQAPLSPLDKTPLESNTHLRIGYFRLLKYNINFRRLWAGQLISGIGDWFYTLALYDLLYQLTGSGKIIGLAIILQSVPWFVMTPIAGLITDRFPRRQVMIVTDLARAGIVLGLLLIETRGDLWLVYILLGLEVSLASLFEPARNSIMPDLVEKRELMAANALVSATWSLTLAIGMALGGLVTATLGREVTFLVNSGSFLISAVLIGRILVSESHFSPANTLPRHVPGTSKNQSWEGSSEPPPLPSFHEGLRYLRLHSKVFAILLAKTGLGVGGGMLLVLVFFGQEIFLIGDSGVLGTALLFAARGIGTLIGPLVGEVIVRGRPRLIRPTIAIGFFLAAFGYLALSYAPNLFIAALVLMLGHMGSSNIWVMSTALLQLSVPTKLRGRIFSIDMGLHTLATSISTFLLGKGHDEWGLSPRAMAAIVGFALLIPAILWTLRLFVIEKKIKRKSKGK